MQNTGCVQQTVSSQAETINQQTQEEDRNNHDIAFLLDTYDFVFKKSEFDKKELYELRNKLLNPEVIKTLKNTSISNIERYIEFLNKAFEFRIDTGYNVFITIKELLANLIGDNRQLADSTRLLLKRIADCITNNYFILDTPEQLRLALYIYIRFLMENAEKKEQNDLLNQINEIRGKYYVCKTKKYKLKKKSKDSIFDIEKIRNLNADQITKYKQFKNKELFEYQKDFKEVLTKQIDTITNILRDGNKENYEFCLLGAGSFSNGLIGMRSDIDLIILTKKCLRPDDNHNANGTEDEREYINLLLDLLDFEMTIIKLLISNISMDEVEKFRFFDRSMLRTLLSSTNKNNIDDTMVSQCSITPEELAEKLYLHLENIITMGFGDISIKELVPLFHLAIIHENTCGSNLLNQFYEKLNLLFNNKKPPPYSSFIEKFYCNEFQSTTDTKKVEEVITDKIILEKHSILVDKIEDYLILQSIQFGKCIKENEYNIMDKAKNLLLLITINEKISEWKSLLKQYDQSKVISNANKKLIINDLWKIKHGCYEINSSGEKIKERLNLISSNYISSSIDKKCGIELFEAKDDLLNDMSLNSFILLVNRILENNKRYIITNLENIKKKLEKKLESILERFYKIHLNHALANHVISEGSYLKKDYYDLEADNLKILLFYSILVIGGYTSIRPHATIRLELDHYVCTNGDHQNIIDSIHNLLDKRVIFSNYKPFKSSLSTKSWIKFIRNVTPIANVFSDAAIFSIEFVSHQSIWFGFILLVPIVSFLNELICRFYACYSIGATHCISIDVKNSNNNKNSNNINWLYQEIRRYIDELAKFILIPTFIPGDKTHVTPYAISLLLFSQYKLLNVFLKRHNLCSANILKYINILYKCIINSVFAFSVTNLVLPWMNCKGIDWYDESSLLNRPWWWNLIGFIIAAATFSLNIISYCSKPSLIAQSYRVQEKSCLKYAKYVQKVMDASIYGIRTACTLYLLSTSMFLSNNKDCQTEKDANKATISLSVLFIIFSIAAGIIITINKLTKTKVYHTVSKINFFQPELNNAETAISNNNNDHTHENSQRYQCLKSIFNFRFFKSRSRAETTRLLMLNNDDDYAIQSEKNNP